MTTSTLLREARARAHLSQAELARRAGTHRSVVNAYERGARQPGAEALFNLLRATGFDLALVPAPIDLARCGRDLEQVLLLAGALPHRRRGALAYPPLR